MKVRVIVAGAGPAGVVAAYALAERGIDVLLVEALANCPEDMRASTFHAPTLDMMESLGLLDELEAQGLRAPVYQYRNRRTGEVLAFDLGEIADVARHPYRLQCEQYKLSRLVVSRLQGHPHAQVIFQRRVVAFDQDESGVTLHCETPIAIESYKADYLIAAEGANSIIRKWLGVEFEGFTYPEKFLTLSTEHPMESYFQNISNVNYMADAEEWCVMLRVPRFWRVLVPAPESEIDSALLSDEKKTKVFSGLMGDGEAIETHHRTIYRVHQRVAKRYNHGRVLLVGDAAHLNNPLGGLGMNSGIHDVWNLTEKLGAVLLNDAEPTALLDRYDRQRRTVMQEFVQAQTIRNKKALESEGAQQIFQRRMESILADDSRRRDYLLDQSMITSLAREAEIA